MAVAAVSGAGAHGSVADDSGGSSVDISGAGSGGGGGNGSRLCKRLGLQQWLVWRATIYAEPVLTSVPWKDVH